jgi:protein lifeguard
MVIHFLIRVEDITLLKRLFYSILSVSNNFSYRKYLLCALVALIMFGLLSVIFCSGQTCQTLNLVYACAGALIMSFCIVYDTQLMIGGRHKYSFDEDDYIFAALSLYLDIINLFLYILELIGKKD